MRLKLYLFILIGIVYQQQVNGHGMMIDPPCRGSRWRFNESAPINYDDAALNCGGYSVHWEQNGGKCGICGDSFSDPQPRPNEIGGLYGEGVIVAEYSAGSVINVTITVVENHKGYFTFSLCNLESSDEEEECYNPLELADGSDKVYVPPGNLNFTYALRLPDGLVSEHSVLRWEYRAGNNWGIDPDGTECTGCGPQETFKTCTDIAMN